MSLSGMPASDLPERGSREGGASNSHKQVTSRWRAGDGKEASDQQRGTKTGRVSSWWPGGEHVTSSRPAETKAQTRQNAAPEKTVPAQGALMRAGDQHMLLPSRMETGDLQGCSSRGTYHRRHCCHDRWLLPPPLLPPFIATPPPRPPLLPPLPSLLLWPRPP